MAIEVYDLTAPPLADATATGSLVVIVDGAAQPAFVPKPDDVINFPSSAKVRLEYTAVAADGARSLPAITEFTAAPAKPQPVTVVHTGELPDAPPVEPLPPAPPA